MSGLVGENVVENRAKKAKTRGSICYATPLVYLLTSTTQYPMRLFGIGVTVR